MGSQQARMKTQDPKKCCMHGCDSEGESRIPCRQCKGYLHVQCFENVVQKKLRPTNAEGHNIVICSKQCYDKYWNSIDAPRRALRHADGKEGPTDPVSSEALLVEWLAAGNNYVEYRANPDNTLQQQNACMEIVARINGSGVIKRRTVFDVMKRISLLESQMQDAFQWESECTLSDATKWNESDQYNSREKLFRYCKYFDVLEPIFREKAAAGRAIVDVVGDGTNNDRDCRVSPEADDKINKVANAEAVAPGPAATADIQSRTPRHDDDLVLKPPGRVSDVSTKDRTRATRPSDRQATVERVLWLPNDRSIESNIPMSKRKPPPATAAAFSSAKYCVWPCHRQGKLLDCPQCKRYLHEECFQEHVLDQYQLCQPTDADGNKVVVCTKSCFDEYQKFLNNQIVSKLAADADPVRASHKNDGGGAYSSKQDWKDDQTEIEKTAPPVSLAATEAHLQSPVAQSSALLPREPSVAVAQSSEKKCCVQNCNCGDAPKKCQFCQHYVHEKCFREHVLDKYQLSQYKDAGGNNVVVCTKRCHLGYGDVLRKQQRLWCNDGKKGLSDPISSEAVLVDWLAAGDNYIKYRGYNGQQKGKTNKEIAKRINASGVVKNRTGSDVGWKISRIELQMKHAFELESERTEGSRDKDGFRKKLLGRCRHFDVLAPIFRDKTSVCHRGAFLINNCSASDERAVAEETGGVASNVSLKPNSNDGGVNVMNAEIQVPHASSEVNLQSAVPRHNAPVPDSGQTVAENVGDSESNGNDEAAILTPDSDDGDVIDTEKTEAHVSASILNVNPRSPSTQSDVPVPADSSERESVGDGINIGKDKTAVAAPDSDDGDVIDAERTEAYVPASIVNVNSRSPSTRGHVPVPANPLERKSDVALGNEPIPSRPSKKRKRQEASSSHADDVDTQAAVVPDAVRSTEDNRRGNQENRMERLKVARLKQQTEWERRENNLKERRARLEIDLKKTELARQQLAYRAELVARYRDLRHEQHCPYDEIAILFPEMIALFPPEERNKFNR